MSSGGLSDSNPYQLYVSFLDFPVSLTLFWLDWNTTISVSFDKRV
jgi:hypothetical protein